MGKEVNNFGAGSLIHVFITMVTVRASRAYCVSTSFSRSFLATVLNSTIPTYVYFDGQTWALSLLQWSRKFSSMDRHHQTLAVKGNFFMLSIPFRGEKRGRERGEKIRARTRGETQWSRCDHCENTREPLKSWYWIFQGVWLFRRYEMDPLLSLSLEILFHIFVDIII